MKKILSCLVALCLLLGAGSVCLPALAEAAEANTMTTVIVKTDDEGLLSAPTSKRGPEAVKQKVSGTKNTIQKIRQRVETLDVEYTYTHIFSGFSATVKKGDIDKIRSTDGVAGICDTSEYRRVPSVASSGNQISSGAMIGLDEARALGYDGAGTAVAIIDSGFDVNHEAFRLSDESTAKYSKEDIDNIISSNQMNCRNGFFNTVYKNAKIPFAYDYHKNSSDVYVAEHGTHVAGIAAGNSSELAGIAPEAQLLLLRIGLDGEGGIEEELAAFDDAAKFDVAAINMSFSSDFIFNPYLSDFDALREAYLAARKSGILVCGAAGNNGALDSVIYGLDNGTDANPNVYDGITSVASVNNTYYDKNGEKQPVKLLFDSGKTAEIYITQGDFSDGELIKYLPFAAGDEIGDLSGKWALLTSAAAFSEVSAYNPEGVIVNKNDLNIWSSWFLNRSNDSPEEEHDIRMICLTGDDVSRLAYSEVKECTVVFGYLDASDSTEISNFSSWGIDEKGCMTVDITAPGGSVYSSFPNNEYQSESGTSMSSPHICGVAALMEQHFNAGGISLTGEEKADLMESLLMSTADPVEQGNAVAPVRAAGAGLVNLSRAFSANAVLTGEDGHSALNLGDRLGSSFDLAFTVKNFSSETVSYDTVELIVDSDEYETKQVQNSETGEYEQISFITGRSAPLGFTAQTDLDSVTLAPGESAEITVTVTVDEADFARYEEIFTNGFFLDGYVFLSDSAGENAELNIPFLGFAGDWDAVPALRADENGFTVLRHLRELRFVFTGKEGNESYETSFDALLLGIGTSFNVSDLETLFKRDIPEGDYYITVYAVPYAARTDEGQEYGALEYQIADNTPPAIVSIDKYDSDDGSGRFIITTHDNDVAYFEFFGKSIFNIGFKKMV